MNSNNNVWYQATVSALESMMQTILGALPSLVAGLLIAILGIFIAQLAKKIGYKLLLKLGFEKLADSAGVNQALKKIDKRLSASHFISGIIFWIILLVFIVTAANTAGLTFLGHSIDQFVNYLPSLLTASFIFLLGIAGANMVKRFVSSSTKAAGFEFSRPLANFVYMLILVLVFSVSIRELKIDTGILDTLITVMIGSLGIAIALSLGLGSRGPSENALYSIYISDIVSVDDIVQLKDGTVGRIAKIGPVATIVEQENGAKKVIHNREFLDGLVIKEPSVEA
jgi:hypothetical protein